MNVLASRPAPSAHPEQGAGLLPSADVLVLGTHGQGNIGDELLLWTFLDQLGRDHHYRINSYAPASTGATFGRQWNVEVFDTAGDRRALLRHIHRCDMVVFAGGSIVKELYPSTGRWRYATLVMVLLLVWYIRLVARRPVLMSNIGVGPVTTPFGRLLSGLTLRLATLVSVRDDESFEMCRRVRCRPDRLRRVPDAVFVNEPSVFAPDVQTVPDRGRARIALNLNRDVERQDEWEPFLDRLESALRELSRRVDIEIHAVPMQSEFKQHDDLSVLSAFLGRFEDVPSVIHRPSDHREVGAVLAACDLVVSERFHALVVGAVLGRPVIPLVYDVKVAELARQLGVEHCSFEVAADLDADDLAATAERLLDEGSLEGRRLAATAADHRALLEHYFAEVRSRLACEASRHRGT